MNREAGFTLIEAVAMIAIVALVAALALPRVSRATSRPLLEGYALQIAAIMKADRVAAVRRRARVDTFVSGLDRKVGSGASGAVLELPKDVDFEAVVAETCQGRTNGSGIAFLPNGQSCGGKVSLSRPGAAYEVKVNWFTGGVEVVAADQAR